MKRHFAFPGSRPPLAIFVILALFSNACGVYKHYDGPRRPKNEIILIQPGDKQFTYVDLIALDGRVLTVDKNRISALPGPHTLLMTATLDYPALHGRLRFHLNLPFEAEAGDTYTVRATILPLKNKGFAWITSEKNPEQFIVKVYTDKVMLIPED